MRRVISAMAVMLGSLVAAAPGASAVDTHIYEARTFKATAEASNCAPRAAIGQRCQTWVLTATKRTDPDGSKTMLVVAAYDVEITSTGPTRKLNGSGAVQAGVAIDTTLAKASAKATVSILGNCTSTGCTRSSLAVDIKWTGVGAIVTGSGRVVNKLNTCSSETEWDTKTRAATVTAKLGSTTYSGAALPAPTISMYHEQVSTDC